MGLLESKLEQSVAQGVLNVREVHPSVIICLSNEGRRWPCTLSAPEPQDELSQRPLHARHSSRTLQKDHVSLRSGLINSTLERTEAAQHKVAVDGYRHHG